MTHSQKMAPGPPRQRAVDTPMIFPVPTRDAVDTMRAAKDETPFSSLGFSLTTLNISPNILIWIPLLLMVKYTPANTSKRGTTKG